MAYNVSGSLERALGPERKQTIRVVRYAVLVIVFVSTIALSLTALSFAFWDLGARTAYPNLHSGQLFDYVRDTPDGKLLLAFIIVSMFQFFTCIALYLSGDKNTNFFVIGVEVILFIGAGTLIITSVIAHGITCNALPSDGGFAQNICNDRCYCFAKEIVTDFQELDDSGCVGITNYTLPLSVDSDCFIPFSIGRKELTAWIGYWGPLSLLSFNMILQIVIVILAIVTVAAPPSQWGEILKALDLPVPVRGLIGGLIGPIGKRIAYTIMGSEHMETIKGYTFVKTQDYY